ncbi:hypothetical protein D9619_010660 [Psilocybe cf. subviscida]|uniref:Aminoacyl-tRNA synthetase class Ia domain-containing protein n=1 Tax=Psilocybe cf. subviscida TaxID=2480587 RepID=A0A8H5EZL9_9AGAR|nr:hypothetical protein D9619_010660 [Psilocybe cf. subviscida]
MADWNSEVNMYRTLAVISLPSGQIDRQHRPVQYSPSSRTALAEAELEYTDNHVSHSVYVTFNLDLSSIPATGELSEAIGSNSSKVQVLVWTTTLSANMAIAVPDLWYTIAEQQAQDAFIIVADELLDSLSGVLGDVRVHGRVRGSDIIGARYMPIFPESTTPLPIIGAKHFTSTSGTGLAHCAPAHGAEDYETLRDSVADLICHVDGNGEFPLEIADIVGATHSEQLIGKNVLGEGNKEMVALLKSLGRVVKMQKIKHRYPYDWRTKQPIIVTATSYWFANLGFIKEDALTAWKDVTFFPASLTARNRIRSFGKSRSERCISR